jgi:hypothetical protein
MPDGRMAPTENVARRPACQRPPAPGHGSVDVRHALGAPRHKGYGRRGGSLPPQADRGKRVAGRLA